MLIVSDKTRQPNVTTRAWAQRSLLRREAAQPSAAFATRRTMLSPRSPSDRGQLSSEKEDEASQKMAVKAWKAENKRMPSRISKQNAKVVVNHERGVATMVAAYSQPSPRGEGSVVGLAVVSGGARVSK